MKAPPHNMPLRYNVCPTDLVDVVPGAATASASWCEGESRVKGEGVAEKPSKKKPRYLTSPHQCANSGVT